MNRASIIDPRLACINTGAFAAKIAKKNCK